jgi:hypothetical protein
VHGIALAQQAGLLWKQPAKEARKVKRVPGPVKPRRNRERPKALRRS